MTHEPGFYIVKKKGDQFGHEHFLWLAKKRDGTYYQLDNGLPQKLEGECQYDLDQLILVKKLSIGRSSIKFNKVKIQVDAEYSGGHFQFSTRSLLGFKKLLDLFPRLFRE